MKAALFIMGVSVLAGAYEFLKLAWFYVKNLNVR